MRSGGNLIKNVSDYIVEDGGTTKIMEPEIVRTDFKKFLSKYKTEPILKIGSGIAFTLKKALPNFINLLFTFL